MDFSAILSSIGLTPAPITLPADLQPVAWDKKDHNWVFYFRNPDQAALEKALEQVRTVVNAQYAIPKPFRFRAPHMVLVAVLDEPNDGLNAFVKAAPSSGAWGGEVFHLVVADRARRQVLVPEPTGTGPQRHALQIRLSMFNPQQYGTAVLGGN